MQKSVAGPDVSDPGFDVILDINGPPSCYAQICNETGIKMDENTLSDFAFSFVETFVNTSNRESKLPDAKISCQPKMLPSVLHPTPCFTQRFEQNGYYCICCCRLACSRLKHVQAYIVVSQVKLQSPGENKLQ